MKRTVLFLFMMLLSVSVMAQKKYDEITYPELNEFEKANVEEFTLDNGITFYLVEDKELPLIRVSVTVRTGSLLEPSSKTGLASLTGQVMREGGSVNYPADELNLLLENNAAFMSTFIGFGSGGASMNLLKEDFDELLPVFVDLIQNPAFPEDKIDLAKTQAKSNISRRNDGQQGIAVREFRKLIYGKDIPYTTQAEYATIDAITKEDMIDFHKQAFVGNNMMIGVIGDFDTRDMKRKLEEDFGSLNAGSETTLLYPDIDYDFPSTVNLIDKPDVNQSFVFAGHIGGLRENPDYAALQLMNEVLSGSGIGSGRLFQTVRSDLGLAYSVFGEYSSNINYPGFFYVGVMTQSSTTAEAIDAMLAELRKLQNESVPEEELNEAKDRFLNSLVFRYDSKNKILSERINNEYNGLPQDYFDQYVEQLKQVTSEDIKHVANEYIKPDKVQILVVGNAEEIGDQLNKYGVVNNVDISIPLPASDEEEVSGDAAEGKALLEKMAKSINPDGKQVGNVVVQSTVTQVTPMGAIDIKNSATFNYKEVSMVANLETPQGNVTMEVKNGSGVMKAMGQEQPLPPPMASAMTDDIRYHYLSASSKHENLEAEYLGMEEVDGKDYAALRIIAENPITFLVDPETGLPHFSRKAQLNMQTGTFVTLVVSYSDWRNVDGVMYAFSTETVNDGEKASATIFEEVSIN
ncbi:MAG: insulinase family protein [Balneolaceae bacterium]|nr:insulinase family protein [Balneolaceae bacterium]MBO6547925.1 insulinase family protein [Balneolaceae bacterium]MBO6648438.1 insulinase family protein [Balneolaceae bacterium]